ncbi:MAG: ABC transporter substrate-binding protein [Eubacteriales bacterium]
MRKVRILSLLMAMLLVVLTAASCTKKDPGTNAAVNYQPIDDADVVTHSDYTSVYDMIGSKVTIDMVTEDPETGLATVTVDGKTYECGMDFLSMAMVYNTQVPEGSTKYQTSEDVYNEWWRLYIQRWNYLVPEVPLYSNQYFDLYNAKIENFVTTPYWGPIDAIVAASVKKGESNSVILGSVTELSGAFRNSGWGKSSPASSDLDIQSLTSGHATVQSDSAGAYKWNMMALESEPTSVINEDGTLTYTIRIKSGLKFSDGSDITAKNYIAGILSNSTPVAVEAGGSGNAGLQLVGFDAFSAYDGTGDKVYFEGIKLLDDYTFSVTFTADYADYYYTMIYASYSPDPLALYLGDGEIIVDEETKSCGLSDSFYATEEVDGKTSYKVAAQIVANLKWNSGLPYSGPYTVANYDNSSKIATLKINPNYAGDDARGKPSIETISYVKVVSETQMDMFKNGEIDVIAGITGAEDTVAALQVVSEGNGKYAETHYDRAGYGKLGFRADFGPSSFVEVRQAIMYTINRPSFAQTFTGGYGSVVHGPYYEGFSAFQAVKDTINLNQYTYSTTNAIRVLQEGGWIYNAQGQPFDASRDAVRYKKLSGYELTVDNLHFASTDGKYQTVKIDGAYYMPLVINWFGTQPNTVTDLLLTSWQQNPASTTEIGMYITYTSVDFITGLYGEYSRDPDNGYSGTPRLNAINFATGFTSAAYSYDFNWSINPNYYEYYSICYVMDEADFWENYQ